MPHMVNNDRDSGVKLASASIRRRSSRSLAWELVLAALAGLLAWLTIFRSNLLALLMLAVVRERHRAG
jgi:hypothetical protein